MFANMHHYRSLDAAFMVPHIPTLVPLVLASAQRAQHAADGSQSVSTTSDDNGDSDKDAMSVDGSNLQAPPQGVLNDSPAALELMASLGALLALLESLGAFLAPHLAQVHPVIIRMALLCCVV